MPKPKVFVTRLIPAAGLERVREYCDADIWTEPLPPSADVLRRKVSDCEGLLSLLTERIDRALLDAAPRLRVVSNYAVGFNNIDIPAAATERGIAVGNTPGVLTDATADMAFALLISAGRRIVESEKYAVAGQWKTWEPMGHIGQDMVGRTLGIVGMGRIGYRDGPAVSRRLGHAGAVSRSAGARAGRARTGRRAGCVRPVAGRLGLHLRACRLERHHARHVQRRRVCQE